MVRHVGTGGACADRSEAAGRGSPCSGQCNGCHQHLLECHPVLLGRQWMVMVFGVVSREQRPDLWRAGGAALCLEAVGKRRSLFSALPRRPHQLSSAAGGDAGLSEALALYLQPVSPHATPSAFTAQLPHCAPFCCISKVASTPPPPRARTPR